VLAAIDFNDKASFETCKVDDERSDRRLPPKTQPVQPMRAQNGPETLLGIRHVMTQRLRILAMTC
jgi:hypothetical protein